MRVAGIVLLGVAGAVLLSVTPLGAYPWYVSRASGLAAFAALSASVAMGLGISSRHGPSWLPKVLLFELHQFLAVLGLVLVALHAGALVFDSTVPFGAADVLVPFVAPYERPWVAVGVLGAWVSAAVTASFWLKSRIGHRRWRRFHYASFVAYVLALVHGLMAGTDTQTASVYWGYVLSAAVVTSLLAYRIAATRASRRPAAAARATHTPRRVPRENAARVAKEHTTVHP